MQEVLQDFEALHPHIKVKHEVIAEQYMDVIKTRLIGEAAPDVFYLDVSEAPFLIRKDVLEPLNSYITPDFDLADFEPSLLNPFIYQGQIYGLPKDYSTLVLFYNKQAFAAAGLTDPPQTWDELSQYAQLLTLIPITMAELTSMALASSQIWPVRFTKLRRWRSVDQR